MSCTSFVLRLTLPCDSVQRKIRTGLSVLCPRRMHSRRVYYITAVIWLDGVTQAWRPVSSWWLFYRFIALLCMDVHHSAEPQGINASTLITVLAKLQHIFFSDHDYKIIAITETWLRGRVFMTARHCQMFTFREKTETVALWPTTKSVAAKVF